MRVLCCLSALLASLRYSATLSSLAVCSILICSVSLRIFCCSWAMACLVRWGSGVISSPPWNELSAPHETDRGAWPRPLTSSRSIWSDERGKKDRFKYVKGEGRNQRICEENKKGSEAGRKKDELQYMSFWSFCWHVKKKKRKLLHFCSMQTGTRLIEWVEQVTCGQFN